MYNALKNVGDMQIVIHVIVFVVVVLVVFLKIYTAWLLFHIFEKTLQ